MKIRKMWAPKDVMARESGGVCLSHGKNAYADPVPVLVTDASDMPDFEPGDRVRQKTPPIDVFGSPVAWHVYEIAHIYFDGERWCFYSTERTRHPLAKYTKLPREKKLRLRVTVDESLDEETVMSAIARGPGVRSVENLERVEDPDE